jgi:tetratricopeptide (TPR) repeat protein
VSARVTQLDARDATAAVAGEWRPLTDLPAGLPRPWTPPTVQTTTDLIVDVFGRDVGQQLNALLRSTKPLDDIGEPIEYPHRYAGLEPILTLIPTDRLTTPRVVAVGATLIALHAQADVSEVDSLPNAGRIAYALLDRARAQGDCAAQLDVFLLVLADLNSVEADVRSEAASSMRACPGDPTPEWLLGQYFSQQDEFSPDASRPEPATRTFQQMASTFPESPLPLIGQADAALRKGLRILGTAPFAARELLESADRTYQAAARLGDTNLVAFGRARTLIGLAQPGAAVVVLNGMSNAAERPPGRVDLLVAEAVRDFPRAVEVGRALSMRGPAPPQTLFPLRPWEGVDDPDIPSPEGPMSVGSESSVELTVTLSNLGGGAGGSLTNSSYVPRWRADSELIGFDVACPDWAWRRDAVIAGQAELALQNLPETPDEAARRNGRTCYHGNYDGERDNQNGLLLFRTLLRLEAGRLVHLTPKVESRLIDARQNLWRWAGDLGMAEAINRAWVSRDPDNGLAWSRLGEVQYLRSETDDAAASLGTAARRLEATPKSSYTDVTRAQLQRAAALMASGRREEGRSELRTMVDSVESYLRSRQRDHPDDYDYDNAHYATTCYFARQLLGDGERESGEWAAAIEDYSAALEWLPVMSSVGGDDSIAPFPSVVLNNMALAQISNRFPGQALASSEEALEEDPANPVFLMTAGYAALLAKDVDKSKAYDRSALAVDPGAYPAANDLGVLLARQGDTEEAATVLRTTVAAKPDYALGWFNLAVVTSWMGPTHLLESLGARGRAADLDTELTSAKDEPVIDSRLYRTDVDLAKPLPPNWTFASIQSGAPAVPLGLLATLVVVLNLVRGQGHRVGEWTEQALRTGSELTAKVPLLGRFWSPLWAVLVTIVVLAVPVLRSGQTGMTEIITLVLALAMLVTFAIRSRIVAARTLGLSTRQRTWTLGTMLGVGTGILGIPWAPLPVIADAVGARADSATSEPGAPPKDAATSAPVRLALAAPLTLVVVGTLLLLEHAVTSVRLTSELGLAALIMAASLLLPVEPQDGARLGKTKVLATIGVAGVAVLAFLGLL